jgi:hypothetical protein
MNVLVPKVSIGNSKAIRLWGAKKCQFLNPGSWFNNAALATVLVGSLLPLLPLTQILLSGSLEPTLRREEGAESHGMHKTGANVEDMETIKLTIIHIELSHGLLLNKLSDILAEMTAFTLAPGNGLVQGCAAFAVAGVASHLLYFIRGDHNLDSLTWVKRSFAGIGLLAGALLYLTKFDVGRAALLTSVFTLSYFVALYTSISLYRLFLHPLRKFPGPFRARFSNLYHAYIIRKSDNYFVMQELHEKYGPIVRTGVFYASGLFMLNTYMY